MTMTSTAQLRKIKKPVIERRRRERINECLQQLKTLILEAEHKEPSRYSKMEKADILEMTVKHLKSLHHVMLGPSSPRSHCSPSCSPVALQYRPHDVTPVRLADGLTCLSPTSSVGLGAVIGQADPALSEPSQKYKEGYDACSMEVDHFLSTKSFTDIHDHNSEVTMAPTVQNSAKQNSAKQLYRHITIEQSNHIGGGQADNANKHIVCSIKHRGDDMKVETPKSIEDINKNTTSAPLFIGTSSLSLSPSNLNSINCIPSSYSNCCSTFVPPVKFPKQYPLILPFPNSSSVVERSVVRKEVHSGSGNLFSTNGVVSPALFTIVSPNSTYMNNSTSLISPTRHAVIPLYANVPLGYPLNILPVTLNSWQDASSDLSLAKVSQICSTRVQVQPMLSMHEAGFSSKYESTTLVSRRSPQVGDDFPRSLNAQGNSCSPAMTNVSFCYSPQEVNCRQVPFMTSGNIVTSTAVSNNSSTNSSTTDTADMWRPWNFSMSRD